MKKTIQLITIWLIALAMQAQTISEQQARQTAAEFYQTHEANKSYEARSNKPYKSPTPSTLRKAYEAPQQALYVFNNPEETGFVIIAGDERATSPILGWSDNGPFDYDKAPCGLKALLEQYSRCEDTQPLPQNDSSQKANNEVAPLLTTQWSQETPYWNKCPGNDYVEHGYTGCVITAMAQLMNYWQWPKQGRGAHQNRYHPHQFRDISQSIYQWENMVQNYETTSYTDEQADAVALLMADVGCAMDADYFGLSGTNAFPEYVPGCLIKYFNYSRDTHNYGTWPGEQENWNPSLAIKNELQAGRPVLCGLMTLEGSGHEVVIDGFQLKNDNNYFHFNFGWGGQNDGWYTTGRGSGGHNGIYAEELTIGIQPSSYPAVKKDDVFFNIENGQAMVMCAKDVEKDDYLKITIPESVEHKGTSYDVTSIYDLAFHQSNMKSISFPGTIKKIPAHLFVSYKDLREGSLLWDVSFKEGLEEIGDSAFAWSKELRGLYTLPSTIKRIGDEAFGGCPLTYIETGAKDFTIGKRNFNVTDFKGLENAKEIDTGGVTGLHGTYTVQAPCLYHPWAVSAEKVFIPSSIDYELDTAVPYFGYEVESGHPTLCSRDSILYNKEKTTLLRFPIRYDTQSLRIPDGVVVIADGVGGTLTLPASLKEFHCNEFGSENKRVYCLGTTPPKIIGKVNPKLSQYGRSRLMIPKGTRQAYEQADVWKEFNNICEVLYIDGPLIYNFGDDYGNPIDGYAQVIGRNMDYGFDGHISIPETITIDCKDYTIGQVDGGAFLYDEAISEVSLPATIYSLGMGGEALVTCPGIHTVTVAEGNETFHVTDGMLVYNNWGRNVLDYCPPMRKEGSAVVPRHSVTVPSEINEIGWHSFSDNLQSVTIATGVDEIKPTAFKRCAKLMEVRCMGEVPPSYDTTYERYGHSFNELVFNPEHGTILYVPKGCIEAYRNSYNEWYRFPDIREFDPASVTPVTIGKQPATRSYNLQGQRVSSGYRGIVVSSGRKVLVK